MESNTEHTHVHINVPTRPNLIPYTKNDMNLVNYVVCLDMGVKVHVNLPD